MHAIHQLECNYQLAKAVATDALQAFTDTHILATITEVVEELEAELNVWGVPVNCTVDRVTIDLELSDLVYKGHSESADYCQQLHHQLKQAIVDALPTEQRIGFDLKHRLSQLQAAFTLCDSANIIHFLPQYLACAATSQLFYLPAQAQLKRLLLHMLKHSDKQILVAQLQSDAAIFAIISCIEPRYASDIIALIQSELTFSGFELTAKPHALAMVESQSQAQAQSKATASTKNAPPEHAPKLAAIKHDAAARQRLIHFSLSYLACERGSEFNRKSYLRSVIRQLADHDNVSIQTVCQQLHYASMRCRLTPKIHTDLNNIIQLELASLNRISPWIAEQTPIEPGKRSLHSELADVQDKCTASAFITQCLARLQGGQRLSSSQWQALFSRLQADNGSAHCLLAQGLIKQRKVRERFLDALPNDYQQAFLLACIKHSASQSSGSVLQDKNWACTKPALTTSITHYRVAVEAILLAADSVFIRRIYMFLNGEQNQFESTQTRRKSNDAQSLGKNNPQNFDQLVDYLAKSPSLIDGGHAAKWFTESGDSASLNGDSPSQKNRQIFFETQLLAQLRINPADVHQKLCSLADNDVQLRALFDQLSHFARERVLLSLSKATADLLFNAFSVLEGLIQRYRPSVNRVFVRTYWWAAFRYLVGLKSASSDKSQHVQGFQLHTFLAVLEHALIAEQNTQFITADGQWLTHLQRFLSADKLSSNVHHDLVNALNRAISSTESRVLDASDSLKDQAAFLDGNQKHTANSELSAEHSRLLIQFAQVLHTGRCALSASDWLALESIVSAQLQPAIMRSLTKPAAQHWFLDLLPQHFQRHIIGLLCGDQAHAIRAIWSDTHHLYLAAVQSGFNTPSEALDDLGVDASSAIHSTANTAKLNNSRSVGLTESRLSRVVQVFTLELLVNDRGSVFNQRSFARALLRQISAHFNLQYTAVLHKLAAVLSNEADNAVTGLFAGLLQDLPIENALVPKKGNKTTQAETTQIQTTQTPNDTATVYAQTNNKAAFCEKQRDDETKRDSEIKNDGLINGAAAYDEFFVLLHSATPASPSAWQRVLRSLRERYPHYAYRLLREWQCGAVDLWANVSRISEQAAQLILDNLLFITGHKNPQSDGGIGPAITHFARQSMHPLFFYLESADTVLAGGVIDLDRVERRVQQRVKTETATNLSTATTIKANATDTETSQQLGTNPLSDDKLGAEKYRSKKVHSAELNPSHDLAPELSDIAQAVLADQLDITAFYRSMSTREQALLLVRQILANKQVDALARLPERQHILLLASIDHQKLARLWPLVQRLHAALLQCIGSHLTGALHAMLLRTVLELISDAKASIQRDFIIQLVLHRFKILTGGLTEQSTAAEFNQWQQQLSRAVMADLSLAAPPKASANGTNHSLIQQQLLDSIHSMRVDDIVIGPNAKKDARQSARFIDKAASSDNVNQCNRSLSSNNSNRNSNHTKAKRPSSESEAEHQLEKLIHHFDIDDKPEEQILNASTLIDVVDAGVVLLSPYLPMLFDKLGLLDAGKFSDTKAQQQALQSLTYLCSGEAVNKTAGVSLVHALICGFDFSELNTAKALLQKSEAADLSSEARETCDGLLSGVIGHWQALGNTRIEGLREVFLQRGGHIMFEEEKGWMLSLEARTFDVMLKRLPWGFSAVKHGFMSDCIFVEWG